MDVANTLLKRSVGSRWWLMHSNGHCQHGTVLGEDAEYKKQIKIKYFFRLKINSLSICRLPCWPPRQRCAALSKAVLVGAVVSSLSLPPLPSLLPLSLVIAAAVVTIVVVIFVESLSATSTAATATHQVSGLPLDPHNLLLTPHRCTSPPPL